MPQINGFQPVRRGSQGRRRLLLKELRLYYKLKIKL